MVVSNPESYVFEDNNKKTTTEELEPSNLSPRLYPKHVTDAGQQDLACNPASQREGGFLRQL
jgi:hypothetical protein